MPDPYFMPTDDELRTSGSQVTVGVLHPGEMGSAVGASTVAAGARVIWVSEDRSAASRARADADGLHDVHWLNGLVNQSHIILSICPPDAAEEVAESVTTLGFHRIYVDANAVSPATVRRMAARIEETGAHFVDGGIIGGPPRKPGTTRLYLSGEYAPRVATALAGGPLEVRVLEGPVGAASALKMAYASWTKGTQALLAAVEALAIHEDVLEPLLAEWRMGRDGLEERAERLGTAAAKAWRWVGEMEQIAATYEAAGLPGGFHLAAADIYSRLTEFKDNWDAPGGPTLARSLLREPRTTD